MTSNQSPNQDHSDDHFEEHLRGFRPISPRTLMIPRHRAPWKAMAAVGVVLAAGISFFPRHVQLATRQRVVAPPVTLGTLNAALRADDETLNRLLDEASPNILPHSQHGTVLYELGKE